MAFSWFFESGERIFIFVIVVISILIAFYQIIFTTAKLIASKQYKFEGKHVFITGGSQGLGLSLATQIAQEGAKITIIARRTDILESAVSYIVSHSKNQNASKCVQYFSADVTDENKLRCAVANSEQRFGKIDMLITCHGFSNPK